jgi:hypothetical protein
VDQDSLISQVAAANPHTVVVLNTGGPVVMPWLNQVKGLFEAWYPGQQDGNAIAALLFGDVNPSAKLPETFPASQQDIPTQTPQQYPGVTDAQGVPHSIYSEGLLVGYRWYDAKKIAPLFPFGFGLSYSTFAYGQLGVAPTPAGPALATVSVAVTNTGRRSGADVPQLYIADPTSTGEPPKQLKGYQKVILAPGEAGHVSFPIDARALSYWSTAVHGWRVARGCYGILIGRDERDIALQTTIAVNGAACPGAVARITTPGAAAGPSCGRPTGRLAGRRLGPVRLGARRSAVRRAMRRFSRRGRHDMDFFCLLGGPGIRVGYPSSKLLRALPRGQRRRVSGHAVLALTANRYYSLRAVRPGESVAEARPSLKLRRAFQIGLNTWYLTPNGSSRGVLKVRHGRVQEVGIADQRLTENPDIARRFLSSFS